MWRCVATRFCGATRVFCAFPMAADFFADAAGEADAPLFFGNGDDVDVTLPAEQIPLEPSQTPDALGKRRADADATGMWERRYLGTFVLSAYSMVKGSEYVHAGDRVVIGRRKKPTAHAREPPNKQTKLATKTKKATPPARAKARQDNVVRFSNVRGFEVGRFPVDVGGWMARLVDEDIVEFDGSVVDCPPTLSVGCDILLEVRVRVARLGRHSPIGIPAAERFSRQRHAVLQPVARRCRTAAHERGERA